MADEFASLRVDTLALHAVLRLKDRSATGAVAIVDDSHGPGVVLCCSADARSYGVKGGMAVSRSLGRCHSLQILSRSRDAEAAADRILRDAAWALSPVIEPMADGGYRVAISGQPVGPWLQRAKSVLEHLRASGLPGQMGVASTPGIADLAAAVADPLLRVEDTASFLRLLAVEAAPLDLDLKEAFTLWGLHDLEQVRQLPRAELGDRLGARAVELWDCLRGRDSRPLQALADEVDWGEQLEPEWPVETADSLLFLLRRLLDGIHMRLTARCKAVRRLTLKLRFEDRTDYRHSFRLPEATVAADTLFALLANHLQDLRTPAAITAVRIDCEPIDPTHRQLSFFETTLRNPARFADTLTQLIGIVGNDCIGSPRLEDSHRDDAWRLEPLADTLSASPVAPCCPMPALRRHRPALAATVTMANGRPSHLQSSCYRGVIRASRGPWQSSGDWWTAASWRREEWDVQLADGTLCRLHRDGSRWWVDGVYD